MFEILHELARTMRSAPDRWRGCSHAPIYPYREAIDSLARELSRHYGRIHARYNRERECAELYDAFGSVVASLMLGGHDGLVLVMVVDTCLPKSAREYFDKFITLPIKYRQYA